MTGKNAFITQGAFITLEGIDGCGKSTQANLLCRWLENLLGIGKVLRTFEPGGWSGGTFLRRVLLEEMTLTSRTELLLFLADRSGHLDSEVLPALKRGQWVVCERYTDSTLAYQSWGRGIAAEAIDGFLNWCRFPAPDITFLLDVDEKTARSRLVPRTNPDRIESEFKRDLMTRVIQGYRELARRNPQRVVVVDATSDIQHVAERISQHVAERICRHVAERAAKPEEELMEKIEKLALAGRTVKIG